MRAWVPYVNVMLFEGKVPYDNLASKDYYPTKKYIKLFDKAVHKAEETYLCPQEHLFEVIPKLMSSFNDQKSI